MCPKNSPSLCFLIWPHSQQAFISVRHCSKCIIGATHSILTVTLWDSYNYGLHFTEAICKAWGNWVICQRSHSWKVRSWVSNQADDIRVFLSPLLLSSPPDARGSAKEQVSALRPPATAARGLLINDSPSSWAGNHRITFLIAGAVGVYQPQVQSQEEEL